MSFVGTPFNMTKTKVYNFLKASLPGTTIVANNTLYKIIDDKLVEIEQKNPEQYLSSVQLDDISINCTELINKFPDLEKFNNINPISVLSGTHFNFPKFPSSSKAPNIFSVSKRIDSNYFDLVAYFFKKDGSYLSNLNYNYESYSKFRHSGDVQTYYCNFNHSIWGLEHLDHDTVIIICAVGYRKVPLINFKTHTPFICINTDTTLYLVPCTLEQSILGTTGNVITLAVIELNQDNQIEVIIPTNPAVLSGKNLSDRDSYSMSKLFKCYEDCKMTPLDILKEDLSEELEHPKFEIDIPEIDVKKKYFFAFPLGFDTDEFNLNFNPNTDIKFSYGTAKTSLPISEFINGPISVLASTQTEPYFSWDQIKNCSGIMVIDSNRWPSVSRVINCNYLFNGCFLIISKTDNLTKLISDKEKREKKMNEIQTNFSCMAGPESLFIVRFKQDSDYRDYWLEGVRKHGLFDIIPKFGEDVTEKMIGYVSWMKDNPTNNWFENNENQKNILSESIMQLIEDTFELQKDTLTLKSDSSTKKSAELATLIYEKEKSILENLVKCQELIRGLKNQSVDFIDKVKHEFVQKTKDSEQKLKSQFANTYDLLEFTSISSLQLNRNITKLSKNILDIIGNLFSSKNSSSRGFSLKQQERIELIKKNVEDINKMNVDEYITYLETCTADGTLVLLLSKDFICLENLSNSSENNSIKGLDLTKYLTLDTETSIALIENQKLLSDRKDELSHAKEISIRISSNSPNCAILIPQNDPKDFSTAIWTTLANIQVYATFRIKLRDALSKIRLFDFLPSSPNLTTFIINMYITICKKLISNVSNYSNLNFTDSIPISLRSLLGHILTTCASGTVPFSNIYKLTAKTNSIKLSEKEYKWAIEILNIFKYAKLDSTIFNDNLKQTLISDIGKPLNKSIENAQKNMKYNYEKELQNNLSLITLNLQWVKLVAYVVSISEDNELSTDQIEKLYNAYPKEAESKLKPKRSIAKIFNSFKEHLEKSKQDISHKYDKTLWLNNTLAEMTLKHSNCLDIIKKKLVKKIDSTSVSNLKKLFEKYVNQLLENIKKIFKTTPNLVLSSQEYNLIIQIKNDTEFIKALKTSYNLKPWSVDPTFESPTDQEFKDKAQELLGLDMSDGIQPELPKIVVTTKEALIVKLEKSKADEQFIDLINELLPKSTREIYNHLTKFSEKEYLDYDFIIKVLSELNIPEPELYIQKCLEIFIEYWYDIETAKKYAFENI